MGEYLWYHNGDWLPQSEVRPDPADRGVMLGDQVLEMGQRHPRKRRRGWTGGQPVLTLRRWRGDGDGSPRSGEGTMERGGGRQSRPSGG